MKVINGIISSVLAIVSLIVMFFKATTTLEFTFGFVILLSACLFLCFMIMDEQKEEVERLRNSILRSKGII